MTAFNFIVQGIALIWGMFAMTFMGGFLWGLLTAFKENKREREIAKLTEIYMQQSAIREDR